MNSRVRKKKVTQLDHTPKLGGGLKYHYLGNGYIMINKRFIELREFKIFRNLYIDATYGLTPISQKSKYSRFEKSIERFPKWSVCHILPTLDKGGTTSNEH